MQPIRGLLGSHCHYYISTKDSTKAYNNSLALHTNENPKDILINRQTLDLSSNPLEYIVASQIHSNTIEIIEQSNSHGWSEASSIECDGLITNQKNLVLTILTADCVPVLLYDKKLEVIGAVHAGWKGTQLQITAKAVDTMKKHFGSNPNDIHAYIAPSIGQCCYEVGEDVAKYFSKDDYIQKGNKFMLDLPSINHKQLLAMELPFKNIQLSNICTACEVDSFFSYRKECGCSGRFMSMVWMES
jgi:YfiH family protein